MLHAISFKNVSCQFGDVKAVDDLNLEIAQGEFFAMLGPSGSGKTTCLRMIAGFQQQTSGTISIFGENVNDVPPYKRNINNVFQDYALFPHMTVLENVAYGLMVKGVNKKQRREQAIEALEQVQLPSFGDRKPSQLSGGQRQRVALARALVNKPKVLLLDEPLGALDLNLREKMQEELKLFHARLGITFVLVTHDQGEALSMADRVAIFNHGKIEQVGTPSDIYQRPVSSFIAKFVGSSNILEPAFVKSLVGVKKWASLKPEFIKVSDQPVDSNISVHGKVISSIFMGASSRIVVEVKGQHLSALIPFEQPLPKINSNVWLSLPDAGLHLMDGEVV